MMCAGCLSSGEAFVISACGVVGMAKAAATRRGRRRADAHQPSVMAAPGAGSGRRERPDHISGPAPLPQPRRSPNDDRSGRESGEREHWARYGFALALYVAAALLTLRWRDNVVLLNWIIGPLFPVVVLFAVPTAARRVRRRWAR